MQLRFKPILILALCVITCWYLASCKNGGGRNAAATKTEIHNHDGHYHEECGHTHDAAGHDSHEHSHDGHDHDSHDHTDCDHQHEQDHSHESTAHSHDGHDHDAHNHDNDDHGHEAAASDEITLSEDKAREAGVEAETVVPGDFQSVIPVSGRIISAPGDNVTLTANVSGIVSFEETIAKGSKVTAGNSVFSISAANLQDGDPAGKARIALEKAKKEYERAEILAKDNIVSKEELEQKRSAYETAKLQYRAYSSNDGKGGTAVKAPNSGFVTDIAVKNGDYVTVGTPLMTIAANDNLMLQADLSARYFQSMNDIDAANFILPYSDKVYSTKEFGGFVIARGHSIDEVSAYLPVTFSLKKDSGIIPGSYAEVFLLTKTRHNVISVPKGAITEEQGNLFVYVKLDASCYKKRSVRIGETDGIRYEILSGLEGGENVVTKGAIHVKLASASNAIPAHSHSH